MIYIGYASKSVPSFMVILFFFFFFFFRFPLQCSEFHTPAPVESIDSSREKKRDSDRSLPTRRKQNGVRISVDFEVGSNGKIPMQSISVIQILSLLMLLYVFGVH